MVYFSGSPSHLGIAVLIVPSGSFFHAQTKVSVDITEELSLNVRMIHFSLNILREHQVGWSSFRLTTGHFSVIENNLVAEMIVRQLVGL